MADDKASAIATASEVNEFFWQCLLRLRTSLLL
jgi:hypothetical protein